MLPASTGLVSIFCPSDCGLVCFFLKNRTLVGFDVAGTEQENTNDDNQLLKGVKSNIFIIELHGEFWCA